MKPVIFRGKSIATGDWVEGYYLEVEDFETGIHQPVIVPFGNVIQSHEDIEPCKYEFVDPDTVGQWVGVVDHDGIKIYEGDVLELLDMYDLTSLMKTWTVTDIRDMWPVLQKRSGYYRVVGDDIYG